MEVLKFYRVKDWYKNLGVTLVGFLFSSHPLTKLPIRLIVSALSLSYAFVLNDFFDGKRGEENYIEKLDMGEKVLRALVTLPAILSILISYLLPFKILVLNGLFLFLFTIYSGPLFFKEKWYFSLPINSICLGPLLFFLGYLPGKIRPLSILICISFSFYILILEIIHQLAHRKEDKKMGVDSLPVVFGFGKIKKAIKTICLLMVVLTSVFFIPVYRSLAFVPLIIWVARYYKIKDQTKNSNFRGLRNKLFGKIEGLSYLFYFLLIYFLKSPFLG